MNTQPFFLCAALLAASPYATRVQAAPVSPKPVTLRYKWTPGEVLRYQLTMDMHMAMTVNRQGDGPPRAIPPLTQHMVVAYSATVQSVNPADGSATLVEHITQMTAVMNGKPLPGMDALAKQDNGEFTMVMSPTGRMLSMQMPPSLARKMPRGMDLSNLGGIAPAALPPGPVRVGDTWQGKPTVSPLFGQIPRLPAFPMTMVSSLASVSRGAHPVAVIRQTYGGTLGAVPLGGESRMNMTGQIRGSSLLKFDIDRGSVVGQDGSVSTNTSVLLPKLPTTPKARQMDMRLQMETHLERLPAAR